MSFAIVIAALLNVQTQATQAEPQRLYTSSFPVAEPRRLALTPKLDGHIDEEEWDELASDNGTRYYLQWAPGRFFVAARIPTGKDAVVSFDFKNNGWLVGNDNVEVRISPKGTVHARRLDATNPNAPTWIEMHQVRIASTVVAGHDGRHEVIEAELIDPATGTFDLPNESKFGVRFDSVDDSSKEADPFQPRVMSGVQLAMYRSQGLPGGMTFTPQGPASRIVEPGTSAKMRFGFTGSEKLGVDKFGVRSEGFAKDETGLYVTPFPAFDNKGRTIVDYGTAIRRKASTGYRVLRGTISTNDGLTSIVQMSYYIAPQFELVMKPQILKRTKKGGKVRINYYVVSNSISRVEGTISVTPPAGFRLTSAPDSFFSIYSNLGTIEKSFDVEWMDVKSGTHPVKFKVTQGAKVSEYTLYLTVDASEPKK